MSCRFLVARRCTCPDARTNGFAIASNVCKQCPHYDGPVRGAGDVVAKVTKFMGIAPCSKCQKRREAMNEAIPASCCGNSKKL